MLKMLDHQLFIWREWSVMKERRGTHSKLAIREDFVRTAVYPSEIRLMRPLLIQPIRTDGAALARFLVNL